jgi:hypothetical protein
MGQAAGQCMNYYFFESNLIWKKHSGEREGKTPSGSRVKPEFLVSLTKKANCEPKSTNNITHYQGLWVFIWKRGRFLDLSIHHRLLNINTRLLLLHCHGCRSPRLQWHPTLCHDSSVGGCWTCRLRPHKIFQRWSVRQLQAQANGWFGKIFCMLKLPGNETSGKRFGYSVGSASACAAYKKTTENY